MGKRREVNLVTGFLGEAFELFGPFWNGTKGLGCRGEEEIVTLAGRNVLST